jgi:hypothetical protein
VYAIEKDHKIPAESRGRKPEYPFRNMNVGDSFFVPQPDPAMRKKRVISICGSARRHKPWIFTCRESDSGVRVWRVG